MYYVPRINQLLLKFEPDCFMYLIKMRRVGHVPVFLKDSDEKAKSFTWTKNEEIAWEFPSEQVAELYIDVYLKGKQGLEVIRHLSI